MQTLHVSYIQNANMIDVNATQNFLKCNLRMNTDNLPHPVCKKMHMLFLYFWEMQVSSQKIMLTLPNMPNVIYTHFAANMYSSLRPGSTKLDKRPEWKWKLTGKSCEVDYKTWIWKQIHQKISTPTTSTSRDVAQLVRSCRDRQCWRLNACSQKKTRITLHIPYTCIR